MFAQRITVSATTDASGDATVYSPVVNGSLHQVRYVKVDFPDGVDFTITNESTAETLWAELDVNASSTRGPRQATHSTAGVASLYAAGGTAVTANMLLANDRIKIVVANGGNTKTGTFHFLIG